MALCKSHTMANARGSFRIAKTIRKPTLIFLDDLLLTEGARSSLTR